MRDLCIMLSARIKIFLGMCNIKGCYRRATANVYMFEIETKRCLCDKHSLEFLKRDLKRSIYGR